MVECDCLENSCSFTGTVGSNPTLSDLFTKIVMYTFKRKIKYRTQLIISIASFFGLWFLFMAPWFLSANVQSLQYKEVIASWVRETKKVHSWIIDMSNELSVKHDFNNITYIIQEDDTLKSISDKFNVSVENIKEKNQLSWDKDLKTWSPIFLSKDNGFLYEVKERWTIRDFAKKYDLWLTWLMAINFVSNVDLMFEKDDQIMLPLSVDDAINKKMLWWEEAVDMWLLTMDDAIKKWFVARPEPVITSTWNPTYTPTSRNTWWQVAWRSSAPTQRSTATYAWWHIVKQYYLRLPYNGRWMGHCTQYAAARFFPNNGVWYKHRRGNARQRLGNARAAWYPIGYTPRVWAIAQLYIPPWSYWYYYGHVWYIEAVDWNARKVLVSDMNYRWLYIVTRRWVSFDWVVWYIYHK